LKNKPFHKKQSILAIIPARGGSKGVPRKNIKLLDEKPLISYTINSAKKSALIDTLILSSDDDEIINLAKNLNVNVPFKRPEHLAKDNSGSLDVVQHAIQFLEKQNKYFDAVLLLQPTTPFREDGFIDKAIEKFCNAKCDALVSVLPVPHQYNPHWVFKKNSKGFLEISTAEKEIIKRRQDLPQAYFRDGSIYITKTDIIKSGSFYGDKLSYIISNPKNYVNIDTVDDWKKAEVILKSI
jgi:N-acylneuraminate cytidylyltransferase